jgi:hypothetical protein
MKNVINRNLRGDMGETFLDWAQVYFDHSSGNCDKLLIRENVFNDFKIQTGVSKWLPNRFSKAMKAFCNYEKSIIAFNPAVFQNTQKRIIRKVEGHAKEMFYIQTIPDIKDDNRYETVDEDEVEETEATKVLNQDLFDTKKDNNVPF